MNAFRSLAAWRGRLPARPVGRGSTRRRRRAGSPDAKTIGQPQQPQIVPSMIVLNARGAKLEGQKLTLEGISPNAIIFADRPVRSAGHALDGSPARGMERQRRPTASPRRRPTPRCRC